MRASAWSFQIVGAAFRWNLKNKREATGRIAAVAAGLRWEIGYPPASHKEG
jgi:hypothetical protein